MFEWDRIVLSRDLCGQNEGQDNQRRNDTMMSAGMEVQDIMPVVQNWMRVSGGNHSGNISPLHSACQEAFVRLNTKVRIAVSNNNKHSLLPILCSLLSL